MLDPSNVPSVDPTELLARYVFSRSHISRQTQRVKSGAFMPPSNLKFSVTRHRDATEDEIWTVGRNVAAQTERTLYARGDALAATYESQNLEVVADPIEENPNHSNVIGWPADDKSARKLIAEEIAAVARFVEAPGS